MSLLGGIGVRLSIYLQVLLPIVPQVVATFAIPRRLMTKSTLEDVKAITSSSSSVFILGVALILSSVIQAATIQLTAYHAVLILNLNWLVLLATNGTFTFVFNNFLRGPRSPGDNWAGDSILTGLMWSLGGHASLMSIFGIVFWATLSRFDRQTPGCTATTVQTILFRDYPLSSCRRGWLVIYSLMALPIVNWCLFNISIILLALVPMIIINGIRCKSDGSDYIWPIVYIFISILLKVAFIVDTELTIAHNHVQRGENLWTLGQTLGLFLVLPTLAKTWKDSKAAFRMWKARGRLQQMAEIETQLQSTQPHVQSSGVKALSTLTHYEDIRLQIIQNNMIDSLLVLLQSEDREVRCASVDALENFAKHEKLRTLILATNVINLLGVILQGQDRELQASAEALLKTLAREWNAPAGIIGAVAIPAMIGMLGSRSLDAQVQGVDTAVEVSKSEDMLPHVVHSVSVESVANSLKRSDLTQEQREHHLLLLEKLVQKGGVRPEREQ